MKTFDVQQMTPEWFELRRGIPTASNFNRIITAKKMELSTQVDGYIFELLADAVCPSLLDVPVSKAMAHGLEYEAEARKWFELEMEQDATPIGFCLSDCGRFGCSPDSLVGTAAGLEIKCPQPKTQVQYLVTGGLPDEYLAQVHGSLIVTGRPVWWFLSYHPAFKSLLVEVKPNEFTEALRERLEEFWTRFQAIKQIVESFSLASDRAEVV